MDRSILLVLGALLFALVFLDYLWIAFRKGLRTIPGPVFARFSGLYRLSMVTNGDSPQNYRKLHDKYGKIVRVGPNHVSVTDASAILTIHGLGSKFLKTPFYSTMSPFYQGTVMHSMFTTQDPVYHKALKTPVAQLFSMTNMRNFESYADECTGIFIDAMRDLEGTPLNLETWLQWYAFDVVASLTFQRRFGFLEKRSDVDQMIEAIDFALDYVKVIGQLPAWHPWLMGNKSIVTLIRKLFPGVHDPAMSFMRITEDEISRYDSQEKDTGRTDMLAQIRSKQAKDGKISARDLVNHLSNNILAGSDTTSIALSACFYYLIKNPRAYEKLMAEIDDADNKGQLSLYITYQECLKLPYLQAVMKEAMRMHPSIGYPLERFVPEGGAEICGVHLPAGTIVGISPPVIHYEKDIFGHDADVFRPERWLEASPNQLKLMDQGTLVFGAGARTCIGKNISIMEMGKFVPQLLRHFDLEWASPNPTWKTHAVWFYKVSDVTVKFKSRRKAR